MRTDVARRGSGSRHGLGRLYRLRWVGHHFRALQAAVRSEGLRLMQQKITAGESMWQQFQAPVLILQGQKPETTTILRYMKAFHAFNLRLAWTHVNAPAAMGSTDQQSVKSDECRAWIVRVSLITD